MWTVDAYMSQTKKSGLKFETKLENRFSTSHLSHANKSKRFVSCVVKTM